MKPNLIEHKGMTVNEALNMEFAVKKQLKYELLTHIFNPAIQRIYTITTIYEKKKEFIICIPLFCALYSSLIRPDVRLAPSDNLATTPA